MKRPAAALFCSSILFAHSPWAAEPSPAAAPSVKILDRYGHLLREAGRTDGQIWHPVPLTAMSPWIVLATLAAEDKRFFAHGGVDMQATARALWQNTAQGRVVSGGSTVTQQLVRLLEPRPKTWGGKIKEALGAWRLEKKLSKREILEAYLNQVSYGNRFQGIEAAAQGYFGVPAGDLSLAQAALLAGIPKSPAHFNPLRFPEHARQRQKTVLDRLLQWGWISADLDRLARAETLRFDRAAAPAWIAPHFTQYVLEEYKSAAGREPLATTLDGDLQRQVEGLLATHLERLRGQHVTNGAVVVLDNASGDVLAWAGSADFFDPTIQGQVDGVTALRQPGSALKPFIYGRAFAEGLTPADIVDDKPVYFGGFMPRNYDETYHGPVRLREALACSFNIPAVLVAERLGAGVVLNTLHAFGFDSLDQSAEHYGLGLALGNGEVTLLELANGYAALARGGIWKPVQVIMSLPSLEGARRVLDRESSYQVTSILSDNAARARAFGLNSPFHLPFAFAAKTGTTKDYRDNWAVGYTPGWTVGVWVGNFDGQPMRGISGITGAAPLLHDVALDMEQRYGALPFEVPRGIREIDICADSGRLPGPGADCANTITEVFAKGRDPKPAIPPADLNEPPPTDVQAPAIDFPAAGDVFKIDPRLAPAAQALRLKAAAVPKGAVLHWRVDGQPLPAADGTVWWPLRVGPHRVRLDIETNGHIHTGPVVAFSVVP